MSRLTRARASDFVATHPSAVAAAAYGCVALAAGVTAFFTLFTQFAVYDDEGTLLVTIQAFVQGDTLYRDVVSAYGPFYYEVFGGLFALTGHSISTDASRSIAVVVWVCTSLLFGLSAQRLTGSLILGVGGMIAAFGSLVVLANEPMHPHGLSALLLGVFVLLTLGKSEKRVVLAGGAAGAVLAALALTKINLGAFAVAAVVLAAVLTAEPLYRRRWLRWPVLGAFLAMPMVVLARDLDQNWVRDLIALEFFSMTAILVAAWPARPARGETSEELGRWLRGTVAGFIVAFVSILGILMLIGPTPADIYEGIVGDAMGIRDLILSPLALSSTAVAWGIIALGIAAMVTRMRTPELGAPTVWPGLLRLIAGLTIWLTVARILTFAVTPDPGNQVALPLVLAWVAAIPPVGMRESSRRRFLRILLPALAAAEALQVYPVAGSQVGIAALVFVPVGALCLADALACLKAWSVARGAQARERLVVVVSVASLSLTGVFAYESIVQPGISRAIFYRQETELPIPGATLMRLPAPDVQTYTGVVDLLHRYRCTGFVSYPSIDSLYLWSGVEAPRPQIPGAWMKAFDSDQQQRVVDELRSSPRPCVVKSELRAGNWLRGKPPPPGPLVNYVLNDFEPVATSGDFELLLPKERVEKNSLNDGRPATSPVAGG